MLSIVVRGDLPHDECVSDVMERLIDAGCPHEIAAHMAESIVKDFERRKNMDETLELLALSLRRSRLLQRLHLWGLGTCVAIALINAILAWNYLSDIRAMDQQVVRQLLQKPPLHNQKDS